jgi:hypothetical protein
VMAGWQSMNTSMLVRQGVPVTMSKASIIPQTSASKTVCSLPVPRCFVRCSPISPLFIAAAAAPTPPSKPEPSVNTQNPPPATILSMFAQALSFESAIWVESAPAGSGASRR